MSVTEAALVLLCKRPAPGVGKQRLAAALGEQAAYTIAQALLDCAVEDLHGWPGPVVIAPAASEDRDWAAQLLPAAQVLPQSAGNLGERLNALDRALRAQGYRQLLYAGSDTPELQPADYAAVRGALQRGDVALTPAADGGVVLMGARRPWPELRGLPWSTLRLGDELARHCRSAGLGVRWLAPSYDVDELADVQRLAATLAGDARPARQALCALAGRLLQATGACHA